MFVQVVHARALLPGSPPGGTNPRYFQCDDGHVYLVKFAESNLLKLAANEWVGWGLANALKLPVFPCAFVEIGQALIAASPELSKRLSAPGVHFGVQKATHYVNLAKVRVPHALVENAADIPRSVAFDTWILNRDRAKPDNILLHRTGDRKNYRFILTDHGQAFLGPNWNEESIRSRETLGDPVPMERWVAATVQGKHSFEPTLQAIEGFPQERLDDVVGRIPDDWLFSGREREALKYAVSRRRAVVAAVLERAHQQGMFPRWSVTR
jgi:hypothetical protein